MIFDRKLEEINMALQNQWERLSGIEQDLRKFCHVPGCPNPSEHPEIHDECRKRYSLSRAMFWKLADDIGELVQEWKKIKPSEVEQALSDMAYGAYLLRDIFYEIEGFDEEARRMEETAFWLEWIAINYRYFIKQREELIAKQNVAKGIKEGKKARKEDKGERDIE